MRLCWHVYFATTYNDSDTSLQVKAARILERDIDRLVKFAEQQEEVYQKWRTRKERSTEKSSSISPSRSRSQMDSTEQKADLVLPRIGAASSMA